MNFEKNNVTVFGLNRSGIAAANLLHRLTSVKTKITDLQNSTDLQNEIEKLNDPKIELLLGGHDERCLENCDLIVLSPGVPTNIPILIEAKKRAIEIIGELEFASRFCRAEMVAITGTKGKSTTTTITGELMKRSFQKVCVAGNIGVPLSAEVLDLTAEDLVVAEVSSFQLETTTHFHPIISAITNLDRDHLDRHGTIENYRTAKQKIYKNQTDQNWIVLNGDDSIVSKFAENTKAKPIFFSNNRAHDHDHGDRLIFVENGEICFRWDDRIEIFCGVDEIPLIGVHNIRNVMTSIAIGLAIDLPIENIRSVIKNFTTEDHHALEHAFEFVAEIDGVKYINDSKATNVISVKAALESIDSPIILIMGGYDKGNIYDELVPIVRSKVKRLILLGEHTQNIRNAFENHVVLLSAKRMIDAVQIAKDHAVSGDVVLLSPANASFDLFENYKDRGQVFKNAVDEINRK